LKVIVQKNPEEQAYLLADSAQTEKVGAQLAVLFMQARKKHQSEHFRLYLQGDLGAGKTTLARALLQGLGVTGRIKSPTFALLEPYEVDELIISHFDFYRMTDPQEWADAGFAELFVASHLVIAEWPEQARELLPPADLELHLTVSEDTLTRSLRYSAGSPVGLNIGEQLCSELVSL
jgi:tRNA threonylcarbamoyladenosine biosynthesis protein TsaE